MIYPDVLKNSCIQAAINGYFDSFTFQDVIKWKDSASFIVNDRAAFMMRGHRGYISIIVLDDEVVFQTSDQFWSRNSSYPIIDKRVSPKKCLTEFRNLVEMMAGEEPTDDARRVLVHLNRLILVAMDDGYLPAPPVSSISPTIEYLVLQELRKHNISVVDYDFDVAYDSLFMTGNLNKHQFFITQKFDGNRIEMDVHFISNYHLNKEEQSNMVKAALM